MTVKARHYVRIAGRTYAPGDAITYNLPAVDLDYLVKKGAIDVEESDVLPADEYGPEVVFKPMEEAETEDAYVEPADELDDIVPVKKKTSRKKG